jgi:hypothetical protein
MLLCQFLNVKDIPLCIAWAPVPIPYDCCVTRADVRHISLVFLVPVILYVASGAAGAYLANDDFHWLNDARATSVFRPFHIAGRSHFYRPVIEIWFATIVHVCGEHSSCYHVIELIIHGINGVLLYAVSTRAFIRRDLALITASLFVVMPSYAQAVVWISAVTELVSATFSLTALLLALRAAEGDSISAGFGATIVAAGAAMYAHESCATLLVTIPLLVYGSGRRPRGRVPMAAVISGVAIASLFVATTVAANRQSYVFREGHYAIGAHMWPHARDYVLSLYVGRHGWTDYGFLLAVVGTILVGGTRPMRVGLAWLIITMLPFLGFTWGNVGRYTYLPAIGFCWIIGGAIIWIRDRLQARVGIRLAHTTAALLAIIVAGRFASFTRNAIRGEVAWMEAYRTYRDQVTPLLSPQALDVTVPPPQDPRVERDYIEPMLRWHTGNPGLRVRIRGS